MLTEQEYVSGPEENYQWYENEVFREDSYCDGSCQHNLQLAAELGKTLLERNKDLENQVRLAHQSHHDQQREIDLLTKQLEALRGVSESRMRIYEEVDRNFHDAEKKNEVLKKESRSDKAKIDELNALIESQEAQIEELTAKVESLHQRERQGRSRASRRTQSVPSLSDPEEGRLGRAGYDEFRGLLPEGRDRVSASEMKGLRTLQESIRNLKQQVTTEQRKRGELETDLAEVVRDNETLQVRVTLLEQEEKRIKKLEAELEEVEMRAEKMCAQCGKSLEATRLMRKPEMSVEHDDLQEIPNGEFIRLKNGGSAYGSRESLNTLGLELETPIDEQLVTIFNAKLEDSPGEERGGEGTQEEGGADRRSFATSPGEERCGSLLGELEDQYRSLVKKYESLIEAKSKRAESADVGVQQEDGGTSSRAGAAAAANAKRPSALPLKRKEAQVQTTPSSKSTNTTTTTSTAALSATTTGSTSYTPSRLDFTSPLDPTEGRFENGPPEYKRLFQEIFETLRRSIAEEEQEPAPTSKPTRATGNKASSAKAAANKASPAKASGHKASPAKAEGGKGSTTKASATKRSSTKPSGKKA